MRANVLDAIGSPLVRIGSPEGADVAAKLESSNPGGSAKDRPAVAMVERAEREGRLSPGDRIVEPTSGNTGIGLAVVSAVRSYDLTIVMPASKSPERRRVMRAYGAEIELVDGDVTDARERADELEVEGAVQLGQFENPANPRAHYLTTGEEIVDAVGERTVDAFVAGVGTGGTISGAGRRLREEFPDVEIVAVEPARNPVLSTGESGADEYQGMGPGFVSENLDRGLLDSVETVPLEGAEAECRRLAHEEGLLVGQSSGAASLIARAVAERIADPGRTCPDVSGPVDERLGLTDGGRPAVDDPDESVGGERADGSRSAGDARRSSPGDVADCPLVVTVFPDGGERYLSTGAFD